MWRIIIPQRCISYYDCNPTKKIWASDDLIRWHHALWAMVDGLCDPPEEALLQILIL
jgi:hypothetical protein